MSACHYCASESGTPIADSKEVVELRPYGPDGSLVCFDCGTSPEHESETNANMLRIISGIVSSGHGLAITDKGFTAI